jgi:hypothetical protein
MIFLWIFIFEIRFGIDCTYEHVGVAYGPCENNERILVFYWKESCDNKFELPKQKPIGCDLKCGLFLNLYLIIFKMDISVLKKENVSHVQKDQNLLHIICSTQIGQLFQQGFLFLLEYHFILKF